MRIATVDDEPDWLLLLSMVLGERGHEVLSIRTSRALRDSIVRFEPDGIISDYLLEGWTEDDRANLAEVCKPYPRVAYTNFGHDQRFAQKIAAHFGIRPDHVVTKNDVRVDAHILIRKLREQMR